MLVELPHSQPELVEERLSALEDRSLAGLLMRENPALFTRALELQEREAIGRRFSNAALVLVGLASMVAGYVLAPNAFKQPAAHAAPHPAPAVAHRPAPIHRVAPAVIAAPVHHTEAVVAKLQARIAAHEAAARAAHHRIAAIAAAPKALAPPRAEDANAPQSEPAAASAPANAPLDPRLLIDAPAPPDGTKAAPPTAASGHWSPQATVGGQADPCTPQAGRTGIILQSLGRN